MEPSTSDYCLLPPDLVDVPLPPWELTGAAVVFVCGWRSVLGLVRYDVSPVGSYDELAVATLTRQGPTVVEMIVNSEASMVGGRRSWGFPKQSGQLRWQQSGRHIAFSAGARSYRVRASAVGVPLKLSTWCWQMLGGRRVRVPLQIEGTARVGWQGRRMALVMDPFKLIVLRPELLKE